jgi:integrase
MPRRSATKLTEARCRELARDCPERGNRITYDADLPGFGLRVTVKGVCSYVLNYTNSGGMERRATIGEYPGMKVQAARERAEALRAEIRAGADPLAERRQEREAPTVAELCDRYLEEHAPKKRTGGEDRAKIERHVRGRLGSQKVAAITFTDIDRLHRDLTRAGSRIEANRVVALLSKMFGLAIRWGMRSDNPVAGIERNPEEKRTRYLSGDELRRLTEALAKHPSQRAADAVRLLLLTGARRGEVLSASWEQFDLGAGIWIKPSAHTKQKREHRVPLSAPARQLLAEIKEWADQRAKKAGQPASQFVFPGRASDEPMKDLKTAWGTLCDAAGLTETAPKTTRTGKPVIKDGKPVTITRSTVRLHDLRHTYASVLASAGLSLPVIGALLGHTQPATTARYAHLFDDPLRAATERAGAAIFGSPSTGKPGANVALLRKRPIRFRASR